MNETTLYSARGCGRCVATKRALERKGIAYTEVNLDNDEQARQMLRERGFHELPVIITDTDAWSGFRIDKLEEMGK